MLSLVLVSLLGCDAPAPPCAGTVLAGDALPCTCGSTRVDAVDALSIVIEHALLLAGRTAAGTEAARLTAFAELVHADLSGLEAITGQVRRGEHLDVLAALGTLDAALLAAVHWIDGWEASR